MMEQIAIALGPENVCCLTGVKSNPKKFHDLSAIKVYRRPGAFHGHKYSQAVHLFFSLMEISLKERPRIMHLSTCYEGYLGLLAHRWLNIPFVIYAHGNEILAALDSKWEKPRLAMRKAMCVLANSRYTASLVEKAGVKPEAINIIPLGCDTKKFRPQEPNPMFREMVLGYRGKNRIILSVGNLVERKGHDMVIKAMPLILKQMPDTTYLVVGDGPYKKQLELLVSSLGIEEYVVFTGRVSDEELPDFYSLCDVFAMPSRERLDSHDVEGFGIVFLEAGASGKAVVGGRSGGVEDAIIDGSTGLLVDPFDIDNIGQTLIELLKNDQLRIRLGKQGLARVQNEFTWEIVGKNVQKILERATLNKVS